MAFAFEWGKLSKCEFEEKNLKEMGKLDLKHQGGELYKMFVNDDPGMTLTYP